MNQQPLTQIAKSILKKQTHRKIKPTDTGSLDIHFFCIMNILHFGMTFVEKTNPPMGTTSASRRTRRVGLVLTSYIP